MSRDRKNSDASGNSPGDIRLGLDGLLGALGDVIAEVSERLESGQSREVRKSFEVDTGRGPVRAEAGVRVRFADDGGRSQTSSRPAAQPVNPRRPSPPTSSSESKVRAIDYDVFDDGDTWRLSADIPGVDQGELNLADDDRELVIETTGARKFAARCPLPEGVSAKDLDVSLRNGILELTAQLGRAKDT